MKHLEEQGLTYGAHAKTGAKFLLLALFRASLDIVVALRYVVHIIYPNVFTYNWSWWSEKHKAFCARIGVRVK